MNKPIVVFDTLPPVDLAPEDMERELAYLAGAITSSGAATLEVHYHGRLGEFQIEDVIRLSADESRLAWGFPGDGGRLWRLGVRLCMAALAAAGHAGFEDSDAGGDGKFSVHAAGRAVLEHRDALWADYDPDAPSDQGRFEFTFNVAAVPVAEDRG